MSWEVNSILGAVTSKRVHVCMRLKQSRGACESPKVKDQMLLTDPACHTDIQLMPSLTLRNNKQICHSKTAIKLTPCSLSDPLIKGRFPVHGLPLGSGVSLQQPCIILTPMMLWHECDSMGKSTNAAALQACWSFVKSASIVVSAVPPSLTHQNCHMLSARGC